jgi:hypothetical protein
MQLPVRALIERHPLRGLGDVGGGEWHADRMHAPQNPECEESEYRESEREGATGHGCATPELAASRGAVDVTIDTRASLTRARRRRHSKSGRRSNLEALHDGERAMFLIREVMYCKPGKVGAMKEKFLAMAKMNEKLKMPKMRVMTDFCAEQYWTIVAEMEVADLGEFEKMMSNSPANAEDMKKFEEIMKGYHDLVDHGKREIYRIEG